MKDPERERLVLKVWDALEDLKKTTEQLQGVSRANGAWTSAMEQQQKAVTRTIETFGVLKSYLVALASRP